MAGVDGEGVSVFDDVPVRERVLDAMDFPGDARLKHGCNVPRSSRMQRSV